MQLCGDAMRGATLSPPTLYGVQIDYLVNNAGRSQRASAVETSVEVDRALLELNVLGTISLTKAVLPEMLKRESGMVVVISSVAGKMGELVVGFVTCDGGSNG